MRYSLLRECFARFNCHKSTIHFYRYYLFAFVGDSADNNLLQIEMFTFLFIDLKYKLMPNDYSTIISFIYTSIHG